MLINSTPDAPSHIRFHLVSHLLVEFMRVNSRHQHNTIHLKVVLRIVTVIPNFCVSFLVESDQSVINCKGTQPGKELVKANEALTKHV